jgi:hypothetical protein
MNFWEKARENQYELIITLTMRVHKQHHLHGAHAQKQHMDQGQAQHHPGNNSLRYARAQNTTIALDTIRM